jgi:hypothetical protein
MAHRCANMVFKKAGVCVALKQGSDLPDCVNMVVKYGGLVGSAIRILFAAGEGATRAWLLGRLHARWRLHRCNILRKSCQRRWRYHAGLSLHSKSLSRHSSVASQTLVSFTLRKN